MTTMLATDNAPTLVDTRRITEADADYQRLHARYARRLRGSIATLVRGLRSGDQSATTAFIHRHIDLMRSCYVAAHEEGQRDYWRAVSLKKPPLTAPDTHLVAQRLAWYALGSVLKMAREATVAAQQPRGAMTHDGAANGATGFSERSSGMQTLAGDPDPLAQWQASTDTRAGLQAAIGWSGIQDGYLAGGRNDGASPFALVWWELNPPSQHCYDCPMMAAGSPYNAPGSGGNELDRTPGDGRTECGAGCKCSLAYKPAAEREAIATATAWQDYYNTLQAKGGAVDYANTPPEGVTPQGQGVTVGRFNQQMADDRLPNEPLIVPPMVPIEVAQKQALDNVRAARTAWDALRADYPDLPEYPWYFSENGGEHAVPLLYGQFYDYAEVAAALEHLWDANAVWLSLNVAGDPIANADGELAETDGGATLLYSPDQPRIKGKFTYGGRGRQEPSGGGRGRASGGKAAGLTGESHARGGGGGGGGGSGSAGKGKGKGEGKRVAERAAKAKEATAEEKARGKREADAMHHETTAGRGGNKAKLDAKEVAARKIERRASAIEKRANDYERRALQSRNEEAAKSGRPSMHPAREAIIKAEAQHSRLLQKPEWAIGYGKHAAHEREIAAAKASLAKAKRDAVRQGEPHALLEEAPKLRAQAEGLCAEASKTRGASGATVRFGHSVETNYNNRSGRATYSAADAHDTVRAVFGHDVKAEDFAKLVGAGDGHTVFIEASGKRSFTVELKAADRTAELTIKRVGNEVEMHDASIRNDAKTASGGRALLETFDHVQAMGITRIRATAAGNEDKFGHRFNGYITWAKMGFTGNIPASRLGAAQEVFGTHVTRVEQLMKQQGGERWWKANGVSWEASFSFKPGSHSRRVYDALLHKLNRAGGDT